MVNKEKELGSGEADLLKDWQGMWNPFKYGSKSNLTAYYENRSKCKGYTIINEKRN